MKKLIPILVLLAAGGIYWWTTRRDAPQPDDGLLASGTVEATEARLGFEAAGQITEITVREGDSVAAGAVLARLDTSEAEARKRQAEAQVASAEARLAELASGFRREEIAQGRTAVGTAEVKRANADAELARSQKLFDGGAISREALDRSRLAAEVAAGDLAKSREQLALLERGTRQETIAAQRAQVAQAEAAVGAADAALANYTLAAPFAGRISERHREPGEAVAPGAPVVSLLDPADRWVRIYVPETRIGAVALGGAAEIHSDTFPGKVYRGEVTYVASQAEFTPKSVQTQEERVRLVYAVKVRVTDDPGFELKPGMPVDVQVATGPGTTSPTPPGAAASPGAR
jgi:membrane fusion protein YbhG